MATGQASREGELISEGAALPIRVLERPEEFEACVEMQSRTWGFEDRDLIPRRMFVVARKIGGGVLGAYDGERLAGFALALPAHRPGQTYWHSHMLAVAPAHRNRGLGRRLKLAQRERALALGFDLIEWTFDPLEIKNAYFNLEALGAIARHYHPNLYGATSSALQAGLPTDRLTAEWWLRAPRVAALAAGLAPPPRPPTAAEIAVPGEIEAWKQARDPRAAEAQGRIRAAFERHFAAGLLAFGCERRAEGGAFLLGYGEPA
jgi:predicted GNAT superfamily acetyltransferase